MIKWHKRVSAHTVFFPLAALYAVLVVPVSVYRLLGLATWPPGLGSAYAHGHELLFGYAAAVVAGFLLSRVTLLGLLLLVLVWVAGRAAFWCWSGVFYAAIPSLVFVLALALLVVPMFSRSVKKWRNHASSVAIMLMLMSALLYQLAQVYGQYQWLRLSLYQAVLAVSLLMLYMGGRIIAPAVAGHLQTLGKRLDARVQPMLEGGLLLLLVAAAVLMALDVTLPSGWALMGAALLGLIRLLRWRLWLCVARTDLLALGLGYLWLVVGLGVLGLQMVGLSVLPSTAPLHVITVGAMGTLTLTVMARSRYIKAGRHPGRINGLLPAAGLLSAAALLRVSAGSSLELLLLAAWLWSAAFVVLLRVLTRSLAAAPSLR